MPAGYGIGLSDLSYDSTAITMLVYTFSKLNVLLYNIS